MSARYAPEIAKVISASYRYNRESDVKRRSGRWIFPASGRSQPDGMPIGPSRTIRCRIRTPGCRASRGLEYNAGCWVFRGALQRLQTLPRNISSTGVFFQMEFNGFGGHRLGRDRQTLLRRNVPGYAVTNPSLGTPPDTAKHAAPAPAV